MNNKRTMLSKTKFHRLDSGTHSVTLSTRTCVELVKLVLLPLGQVGGKHKTTKY